MELLHRLQYVSDYLVVLFFGRPMIRPRQVLQMSDPLTVSDQELALDQVRHDRLHTDKLHLCVIKLNAFLDFHGPVLIALLLTVLFGGSQHHYQVDLIFYDHAPEVLSRGNEGALRCDEKLVVAGD